MESNIALFPGRTPPKVIDAQAQQQDTVTAAEARWISETNATNLRLEKKTHEKIKGLVESINTLTQPMALMAKEMHARWDEFTEADRQARHVAFLSKGLLRVLMVMIFVSEWALAATVLKGMGLTDAETYVMSGGFVGIAFALTKAVAYGSRWFVSVHREIPHEKIAAIFFLVIGMAVLFGMVYAMSEARVAFVEAQNSAGEVATSERTAHGLTLLQAVLYCSQIVVFWFLQGTNPKSDRAHVNYEHAHKELRRLHAKRVPLAAQLNLLVNTARAKWEENIEHACVNISDYRRAFKNAGGTWPTEASREIRRDWFLPPPERLSPAVDGVPPEVQQLLSTGKAD